VNRKDYEQLATIFKFAYKQVQDTTPIEIVDFMLDQMCSVLKSDNAAFNKEKFVTAAKGGK